MSTEYSADASMVSTVWSAYGHRFMDDGGEGTESCLRCGAMYRLVADATDPTYGFYVTNAGDEPAQCTGDTSMAHGYPGERYCHEHVHPLDRGEHHCSHVDHDCPCILCDS